MKALSLANIKAELNPTLEGPALSFSAIKYSEVVQMNITVAENFQRSGIGSLSIVRQAATSYIKNFTVYSKSRIEKFVHEKPLRELLFAFVYNEP